MPTKYGGGYMSSTLQKYSPVSAALSPWMVRFTLLSLKVPLQKGSSRKPNLFFIVNVEAQTSVIIWSLVCRSTVTRTSSVLCEDVYSHGKLATPWLLANTTEGWVTCMAEHRGSPVTIAQVMSQPRGLELLGSTSWIVISSKPHPQKNYDKNHNL